MSLVSVFTRELARTHRHRAPPGVALGTAALAEAASPEAASPEAASPEAAPAEAAPAAAGAGPEAASTPDAGVRVAAEAARRIAAGHVGDPLALDAYVERARRAAALSFGAAMVLLALAGLVHPAAWLLAAPLGLAAGRAWARARRGARLLIQGGALVVRSGPWRGARLWRADVVGIGFGAPGRAGRRAPEAFWGGDFASAGASHLVVLRLRGAGPRRLIVPEAGVGEARAAVLRLRQWRASSRG